MPTTDKFFAINIRKYLALGNDYEAGEPALTRLLSGFSCPKNPDGVVTFLEAENEEKLIKFYRNNRFSQFDTRQTAGGVNNPHELIQLLRLL